MRDSIRAQGARNLRLRLRPPNCKASPTTPAIQAQVLSPGPLPFSASNDVFPKQRLSDKLRQFQLSTEVP